MSRIDFHKSRRSRGRNARNRCDCDGWWFPHRAGSRSLNPEVPGCRHKKAKW